MDSLLELDTKALFTEDALLDCPTKTDGIPKVLAALKRWTTDETSVVFSGYRLETGRKSGLTNAKNLATALREKFDTLLVLGIGGSALGARTGLSALKWTVPPQQRRRVIIIDNLDPIEFEFQVGDVDLSRTAVALVTKSGGTLETMAQASLLFERYERAGLSIKDHFVAVTDPTKGALRQFVESQGLRAVEVPSSVGGRFSVLTPVGTLPLAFAGIDVDALLEGANKFFSGNVMNLESVAALSVRLAELEKAGFNGHVFMPYASLLKDFGLWFVQLWGESLGKKDGAGVFSTGSIPVAAVGATDQHSLLQLLVDGPKQLVTGFLQINHFPPVGSKQPTMGRLSPEFSSLSYAFGKTFTEILNAEAKATFQVLVERGRPCYQLKMKEPTPEALGALFAFYMDVVTMTAAALGVTPYDQPGVEHGKKMMPIILGSAN